jgi:predicted small metal-binding protein
MADPTITVRCACGWEAVGSEDEVVPATIEHGRRLHNMTATREDVLAMATAAPPTAAAGPSAPAERR